MRRSEDDIEMDVCEIGGVVSELQCLLLTFYDISSTDYCYFIK